MSIAIAGILGGWASLFIILQPYRLTHRMTRLWGIPRFRIADFLSLSLLLLWPLLLARHGRDDHHLAWLTVCFCLFALCVAFLWLRGLWILQQLDIRSFFKRTLFLAVLLPAIVVFSLVIGHGIFSLVILLTFPQFIIVHAAVYGLLAGCLYAGCRAGLSYVFGRPVVEEPPSAGRDDPA